MRWITGEEIVGIDGFGAKTNSQLPDGSYNYGMINLTLSNGSVGFYETGWAKSFTNRNVKEFIGPKGRILLTYKTERGVMGFKGNLITYYDSESAKVHKINVPFKNKPTGKQLEHLIKMIEENVPANPTIDDVVLSFTAACSADEIIKNKLK